MELRKYLATAALLIATTAYAQDKVVIAKDGDAICKQIEMQSPKRTISYCDDPTTGPGLDYVRTEMTIADTKFDSRVLFVKDVPSQNVVKRTEKGVCFIDTYKGEFSPERQEAEKQYFALNFLPVQKK